MKNTRTPFPKPHSIHNINLTEVLLGCNS